MSTVDLQVDIDHDSARVKVDSTSTVVPLKDAFPARGYAPFAVQQEIMREWLKRGRPAVLRLIPDAGLRIGERARDTIGTGTSRIILTRYSVAGLIWGRETLWLDDAGALAAVATVDAEFDPVQGVRVGLEPAVDQFVEIAARDAVAALADYGDSLGGGRDSLVALVGGTLIDGTGKPPIKDAVIVVRGDRIVAAGARSKTKVPRGARTIDTRGATMLPGLWDMHTHYAQVEWGPIYLASGVTTVRDCGNQLAFLLGAREALAAGVGVGPRLLSAGIIDGDGPTAIGVAQAATPAEGAAWVRRYHDAGLEQIKVYSSVPADVLPAITAEAHRLGMTVTGHIPRGMDGYAGVEAGMDQINHVSFIRDMMRARSDTTPLEMSAPEAAKAIQFLAQRHIVVDPTLALYELNFHPAEEPVSAFEPGVDKVAPELRDALTHTGVPPEQAAAAARRFAELRAIVGALHKAGVPIVAGTDLAVPGYSLHRELELYVQAGFTPMEAIQAATLVPARVMGMDGDVGTIQPGLRADVLVVEGDPLANISALRQVRLVLAQGRLFHPAPLWRSVGFTP
jgi:imidazolonepropionase-like amidohydrolase